MSTSPTQKMLSPNCGDGIFQPEQGEWCDPSVPEGCLPGVPAELCFQTPMPTQVPSPPAPSPIIASGEDCCLECFCGDERCDVLPFNQKSAPVDTCFNFACGAFPSYLFNSTTQELEYYTEENCESDRFPNTINKDTCVFISHDGLFSRLTSGQCSGQTEECPQVRKRNTPDFTAPWLCNKECECEARCPDLPEDVNQCAFVDECGVLCGDGSTCVPDESCPDCLDGGKINITDVTGCDIEFLRRDKVRLSAFGTLYGPKTAVIVAFDGYQQGDACGNTIDTCANRVPIDQDVVTEPECMLAPQTRLYNGWNRTLSDGPKDTLLANYHKDFTLSSLIDCRRPNSTDNLVGLEYLHESKSLWYGALRTSLISFEDAKGNMIDEERVISEDVCKFSFTVNGDGVEILCFSYDEIEFKVIWEFNTWDEKNCSVKINIRTFVSKSSELDTETTDTEHLLQLINPMLMPITDNATELMIVENSAPCDPLNTDHGCSQEWTIMSPNDPDLEQFSLWGDYQLKFEIEGLGYEESQRLKEVKSILSLDLEHECGIEEEFVELEAECALSYDVNFTKVVPQDGSKHVFIDCDDIYAACELQVHEKDDWKLWIEDILVCEKNENYTEFNESMPESTGCKSPDLVPGKDTFYILYNGENFPIFFNGRYLDTNESLAIDTTSDAGVCWKVRGISTPGSQIAVQIEWKAQTTRDEQDVADTHVQGAFERRRSVNFNLEARSVEQVSSGRNLDNQIEVHCDAEKQEYDVDVEQCIFESGQEPDWFTDQHREYVSPVARGKQDDQTPKQQNAEKDTTVNTLTVIMIVAAATIATLTVAFATYRIYRKRTTSQFSQIVEDEGQEHPSDISMQRMPLTGEYEFKGSNIQRTDHVSDN